MGFFDLISDVFAFTAVDAESPKVDTGDEHQSSKDQDPATGPQHSAGQGVKGGASTKTPVSGTDEESSEESEVNKQDQTSGGDTEPGHKPGSSKQETEDVKAGEEEEDGDDAGEEEEEEEEPEDQKQILEEECMKTKGCAPVKHHYDECVERVTQQMEEGDGHAKEDCVEEFFHLAHCASNCAAPKLFKQLK